MSARRIFLNFDQLLFFFFYPVKTQPGLPLDNIIIDLSGTFSVSAVKLSQECTGLDCEPSVLSEPTNPLFAKTTTYVNLGINSASNTVKLQWEYSFTKISTVDTSMGGGSLGGPQYGAVGVTTADFTFWKLG